MAGATRELFHWLSALIALPVIAYSGRPFFASAWMALKHRRTNMDVPISIGVLLASELSLYETATHGPHAYFDGAVMLLFFLLCGRWLDSVMRDRARGAGFSAFVEQVRTDKGTLSRVRVGPVANRADADRLKTQVAAKIGVDGMVRPHP